MSSASPKAKVRTVTVGVPLARGESLDARTAKLETAREFAWRARAAYEAAGWRVQTVRVATTPFEEFAADVADPAALEEEVATLVRILHAHRPVDAEDFPPLLINLGPARSVAAATAIPPLLLRFPAVSASVAISTPFPAEEAASTVPIAFPEGDLAAAAAAVMARLATESEGGEANFQFAALMHCPPGIPFFPAAYHGGDRLAFSVGLESTDLFVTATEEYAATILGPSGSTDVAAVFDAVGRRLGDELRAIQAVAEDLERAHPDIAYLGMDTSLAPSPGALPLTRVFECFRFAGRSVRFGDSSCVAIAAAVTQTLQNLPGVKRIGYCGLMLPPLEDRGLAARAEEGSYTLRDLLLLSAVCGIGLDTVPVPGDTSAEVMTRLLLDVAAFSFRLGKKPLSVRLFPVPGKRALERTEFRNPHLCNGPVFPLV